MNRFFYHLVVFLVVAIWGTTFVFTKLLLNAGLTAAQIFVLRFVVAYILLLGYSLTRWSFRWFSASWKDELLMMALGMYLCNKRQKEAGTELKVNNSAKSKQTRWPGN